DGFPPFLFRDGPRCLEDRRADLLLLPFFALLDAHLHTVVFLTVLNIAKVKVFIAHGQKKIKVFLAWVTCLTFQGAGAFRDTPWFGNTWPLLWQLLIFCATLYYRAFRSRIQLIIRVSAGCETHTKQNRQKTT